MPQSSSRLIAQMIGADREQPRKQRFVDDRRLSNLGPGGGKGFLEDILGQRTVAESRPGVAHDYWAMPGVQGGKRAEISRLAREQEI